MPTTIPPRRRRPTTKELLRRFAMNVALPCAAGAAVLALVGGCADSNEGTFNPLNAQRVARAHANADPTENPSPEMRPLPERMDSPFLPASTRPASQPSFAPASQPTDLANRPVRRMSLRELVKRAVQFNADARVTSYQPAIDQARVVEAEAAFDWKFFNNVQYVHQDDLFPTASFPGLNPFGTKGALGPVLFKNLQIQSGFKQDTPTGGNVELRYESNQFDRAHGSFGFTPANSQQDPFWTQSLALQIKQPLLQNFGAAANQARISIARNTQKSSLLDFRLQLEKSLFELEQIYWQLVQAEQDVKIRETLLQNTQDTVDLLFKRKGTQGTTNTEVSQANAALESRRFDLIEARRVVGELSDQLKAKVNDPELPVSGGDLILPADVPIDAPVAFNLDEQINTALTYRAELSQQQIKIDSAEITVRAAKNNELPQFDLVGQIGLDGFAQDFSAAVRNQLRFDYIDYTVGFQFQVPIGNREARAITTRTQLQRLQAIYQYRGLIDQVTFDVRKGKRDVDAHWNEISAARRARIAAEDELGRLNEDQLNREGAMSPSFIQTKLDAQLRLSEAARQEITAMAQYNLALAELERAKGTLLRYDNVTLEEEPQASVGLTWQKPNLSGWKPSWWK